MILLCSEMCRGYSNSASLSRGDARAGGESGTAGAPAAAASGRRLVILDGVSGFAGAGVQNTKTGNHGRGLPPLKGGKSTAAKPPGRKSCGGSVTAIMGPSGAGKSSLLNVLAGRRQSAGAVIAGAVRVNGEVARAATVREVSGYVAQEDVLPETMTCYEHLMFHAELRMAAPAAVGKSRGCSRAGRKRRVLEVR